MCLCNRIQVAISLWPSLRTMQERCDNNKIEPYNHEYPLLYKEAEIQTLSWGSAGRVNIIK